VEMILPMPMSQVLRMRGTGVTIISTSCFGTQQHHSAADDMHIVGLRRNQDCEHWHALQAAQAAKSLTSQQPLACPASWPQRLQRY
jgi:hypothetical protein